MGLLSGTSSALKHLKLEARWSHLEQTLPCTEKERAREEGLAVSRWECGVLQPRLDLHPGARPQVLCLPDRRTSTQPARACCTVLKSQGLSWAETETPNEF